MANINNSNNKSTIESEQSNVNNILIGGAIIILIILIICIICIGYYRRKVRILKQQLNQKSSVRENIISTDNSLISTQFVNDSFIESKLGLNNNNTNTIINFDEENNSERNNKSSNGYINQIKESRINDNDLDNRENDINSSRITNDERDSYKYQSQYSLNTIQSVTSMKPSYSYYSCINNNENENISKQIPLNHNHNRISFHEDIKNNSHNSSALANHNFNSVIKKIDSIDENNNNNCNRMSNHLLTTNNSLIIKENLEHKSNNNDNVLTNTKDNSLKTIKRNNNGFFQYENNPISEKKQTSSKQTRKSLSIDTNHKQKKRFSIQSKNSSPEEQKGLNDHKDKKKKENRQSYTETLIPILSEKRLSYTETLIPILSEKRLSYSEKIIPKTSEKRLSYSEKVIPKISENRLSYTEKIIPKPSEKRLSYSEKVIPKISENRLSYNEKIIPKPSEKRLSYSEKVIPKPSEKRLSHSEKIISNTSENRLSFNEKSISTSENLHKHSEKLTMKSENYNCSNEKLIPILSEKRQSQLYEKGHIQQQSEKRFSVNDRLSICSLNDHKYTLFNEKSNRHLSIQSVHSIHNVVDDELVSPRPISLISEKRLSWITDKENNYNIENITKNSENKNKKNETKINTASNSMINSIIKGTNLPTSTNEKIQSLINNNENTSGIENKKDINNNNENENGTNNNSNNLIKQNSTNFNIINEYNNNNNNENESEDIKNNNNKKKNNKTQNTERSSRYYSKQRLSLISNLSELTEHFNSKQQSPSSSEGKNKTFSSNIKNSLETTDSIDRNIHSSTSNESDNTILSENTNTKYSINIDIDKEVDDHWNKETENEKNNNFNKENIESSDICIFSGNAFLKNNDNSENSINNSIINSNKTSVSGNESTINSQLSELETQNEKQIENNIINEEIASSSSSSSSIINNNDSILQKEEKENFNKYQIDENLINEESFQSNECYVNGNDYSSDEKIINSKIFENNKLPKLDFINTSNILTSPTLSTESINTENNSLILNSIKLNMEKNENNDNNSNINKKINFQKIDVLNLKNDNDIEMILKPSNKNYKYFGLYSDVRPKKNSRRKVISSSNYSINKIKNVSINEDNFEFENNIKSAKIFSINDSDSETTTDKTGFENKKDGNHYQNSSNINLDNNSSFIFSRSLNEISFEGDKKLSKKEMLLVDSLRENTKSIGSNVSTPTKSTKYSNYSILNGSDHLSENLKYSNSINNSFNLNNESYDNDDDVTNNNYFSLDQIDIENQLILNQELSKSFENLKDLGKIDRKSLYTINPPKIPPKSQHRQRSQSTTKSSLMKEENDMTSITSQIYRHKSQHSQNSTLTSFSVSTTSQISNQNINSNMNVMDTTTSLPYSISSNQSQSSKTSLHLQNFTNINNVGNNLMLNKIANSNLQTSTNISTTNSKILNKSNNNNNNNIDNILTSQNLKKMNTETPSPVDQTILKQNSIHEQNYPSSFKSSTSIISYTSSNYSASELKDNNQNNNESEKLPQRIKDSIPRRSQYSNQKESNRCKQNSKSSVSSHKKKKKSSTSGNETTSLHHQSYQQHSSLSQTNKIDNDFISSKKEVTNIKDDEKNDKKATYCKKQSETEEDFIENKMLGYSNSQKNKESVENDSNLDQNMSISTINDNKNEINLSMISLQSNQPRDFSQNSIKSILSQIENSNEKMIINNNNNNKDVVEQILISSESTDSVNTLRFSQITNNTKINCSLNNQSISSTTTKINEMNQMNNSTKINNNEDNDKTNENNEIMNEEDNQNIINMSSDSVLLSYKNNENTTNLLLDINKNNDSILNSSLPSNINEVHSTHYFDEIEIIKNQNNQENNIKEMEKEKEPNQNDIDVKNRVSLTSNQNQEKTLPLLRDIISNSILEMQSKKLRPIKGKVHLLVDSPSPLMAFPEESSSNQPLEQLNIIKNNDEVVNVNNEVNLSENSLKIKSNENNDDIIAGNMPSESKRDSNEINDEMAGLTRLTERNETGINQSSTSIICNEKENKTNLYSSNKINSNKLLENNPQITKRNSNPFTTIKTSPVFSHKVINCKSKLLGNNSKMGKIKIIKIDSQFQKEMTPSIITRNKITNSSSVVGSSHYPIKNKILPQPQQYIPQHPYSHNQLISDDEYENEALDVINPTSSNININNTNKNIISTSSNSSPQDENVNYFGTDTSRTSDSTTITEYKNIRNTDQSISNQYNKSSLSTSSDEFDDEEIISLDINLMSQDDASTYNSPLLFPVVTPPNYDLQIKDPEYQL